MVSGELQAKKQATYETEQFLLEAIGLLAVEQHLEWVMTPFLSFSAVMYGIVKAGALCRIYKRLGYLAPQKFDFYRI